MNGEKVFSLQSSVGSLQSAEPRARRMSGRAGGRFWFGEDRWDIGDIWDLWDADEAQSEVFFYLSVPIRTHPYPSVWACGTRRTCRTCRTCRTKPIQTNTDRYRRLFLSVFVCLCCDSEALNKTPDCRQAASKRQRSVKQNSRLPVGGKQASAKR